MFVVNDTYPWVSSDTAPGTYSVFVRDSNMCTSNITTVIVSTPGMEKLNTTILQC